MDCVEESYVWLCVWEEGMGGMCEISQTQEDRIVIRKKTHNTVLTQRIIYVQLQTCKRLVAMVTTVPAFRAANN